MADNADTSWLPVSALIAMWAQDSTDRFSSSSPLLGIAALTISGTLSSTLAAATPGP